MLVPNTGGLHKIIEGEACIVRGRMLRRCSGVGVLHAVRVHGELEGLHVGTDGPVWCTGDSIGSCCVLAVKMGSAVPGRRPCLNEL